MKLSQYSTNGFSRGAPFFVESVWYFVNAWAFSSCFPGSSWRKFLLRAFGARVGDGVVIKPGVKVKFPWRLVIGCDTWVGEGVWIDNLDWVFIGSNVCISQGAFFCTGNHDWSSESFDLITNSITIEDCAWVGAFSSVCAGTYIPEGAVLCQSSFAVGCLEPWTVYSGNPALRVKERAR